MMNKEPTRRLFIPAMVAALCFSAVCLLPARDTGAEDSGKMKLHYKKGAALYENKDYEGAMEEFVKARFYGPGWELGVNIAKCLEKLERYGEAATALALALEEGEGKIPGDLRTGLEKRLSSLGKKVVVLSISGGLQEHEDLYINGQVTAGVTGSGNIYLDVGQYDVEVRVGEQVLVSKKVDLKEPGGREVLDFERGKEIVIDTGKKKSSGGLKKRWTLWTGLALLLAGHGLNIGGVVQSSQTKSYSQDLEHARLTTTPDHDVCDCHKEDADMVSV